MARKILSLGAAKMIIWDINRENFENTTNELKVSGFNIFYYQVDVANLEQVKQTAQKVKDEEGMVDILINYAGVVVCG